MASFRLEPDSAAALRKHAEERDESLSDVLRRGALLVLGYCPTCQRKVTDDDRVGANDDRAPAAGSDVAAGSVAGHDAG